MAWHLRDADRLARATNSVNFRRLRYFVAVADELHFGRAAARLGIAQPPLSRQIKALEEEMGASLFNRSRNQIRLTAAGEIFQERARDILERVASAEEAVRQAGAGTIGSLTIGFVSSATYGLLPDIVQAFRAANEDVELTLLPINNAGQRDALIQRRMDIGIARPRLDDAELRHEVISRESLVVALPATDPLAGQAALSIPDLGDREFVLYPDKPRPTFADHVIAICRAGGVEPRVSQLVHDYQTAAGLVSVGVGISLVPESTAAAERKGLVCRPLVGAKAETQLSINWRIDNVGPLVRRFVETTRTVSRRMRAIAPSSS